MQPLDIEGFEHEQSMDYYKPVLAFQQFDI